MRKPGLQLGILADQRVILSVRNLRRVIVVIEAIVAGNFRRQPHQPVGRLRLGNIAHSISASSSAIFPTLFMLRAVPCLAAGSLSFDLPMPSP